MSKDTEKDFLGELSSLEKGYLFGLFFGDGYKVYDKNSRHYHVEFYLNSVTDVEIIEFLCNLLKKIGLKPGVYKDKRYNCKRIRVYSKKLFNTIHKKITLSDRSSLFNYGFVSGLIDSEGYVNPIKSYISVVNTDRDMMVQCKGFLDSEGIHCNLSKRTRSVKDKLDSYRMYISVSFKNTNNLSIKVRELQDSGIET